MNNTTFTTEEISKIEDYLTEKALQYLKLHPFQLFKKNPYVEVLKELEKDFFFNINKGE